MTNLKAAVLAIGFMGLMVMQTNCASTTAKKKKSPTPSKPVLTSVHVAFNISSNEYGTVTAQRTIKDTLLPVDPEDENSEMKSVKDTSYLLWILYPVLDSTGHVVKSKVKNLDQSYKDSTIGRFVPCQKAMILQDFNRNF